MSVPCGLIVATDSATNTLRFLSQHLSDYSELPAEIIQITMRHVADPDGETTTVSTHLFKARLVCKTFSKAAVVVLLSLIRSPPYQAFPDYTVLNLPQKSGDLRAICKAMSRNKGISALITKIVYHVSSAPYTNANRHALLEYYGDYAMAESECSCEQAGDCTWCDPERLLQKNVSTLRKQSRIQTRFANHITSEEGSRLFLRLFSMLPNLATVCVTVSDFWHLARIYRGHDSDSFAFIDTPVWQKVLLKLMEQLDGSSRIKELQLLRVGSASFEEIYPQTMLTLESHSELMHNLTKFELTISGRNEMDW
jgi:hypothetical protein